MLMLFAGNVEFGAQMPKLFARNVELETQDFQFFAQNVRFRTQTFRFGGRIFSIGRRSLLTCLDPRRIALAVLNQKRDLPEMLSDH